MLMALSNKFYNTIPHKFDRASTPPIIETADQLPNPNPNPDPNLNPDPNSNPNPNPNPNPHPNPNPDQVDQLRAKSDMVESLLSVSATTIAKQLGAAEAQAEHPNDTYYKRLGCGLEPASAEEVAMLAEYPP